MKKLIILALFTFFLLPFLQAEDIHLTTYYPSPSGVYDEMMVNKMVIGSTDTSSTPLPDTDGVLRFQGIGSDPSGLDDTEDGALYYNSSDDEFRYYDGSAWARLGTGSGCYVSYSGGCLTGFTNEGSAGWWGYCRSLGNSSHFRPPGGGCYSGWSSSNIGGAFVCCQ
jgi:hypothetical protein